MSTHSGSAGRAADGTFVSTVTGPFAVDQGHVELTWIIVKDAEGTLTRLSVEAVDSNVPATRWQTAAYELATSVFAASLAERRQRFFRRSLFFYIGPQLDGEYWLPGYRFAPVYPGDPMPHLLNAERVVSIDQHVHAIDAMHATSLAEESARRHSARLSLLLNVGLYRQENTMRWVLPMNDGQPAAESVRLQHAFFHPRATISNMPEKGKLGGPGG